MAGLHGVGVEVRLRVGMKDANLAALQDVFQSGRIGQAERAPSRQWSVRTSISPHVHHDEDNNDDDDVSQA